MSRLARKFATFQRIARERGVSGVLDAAAWTYGPAMWRRGARLLASAPALPDTVRARRLHGAPRLALGFFGGIGDELLLTTVVHELRRRGRHGTWVFTEYPELWANNAGDDLVLPWDRRHATWAEAFGWNLILPHYCYYDEARDADIPSAHHILRVMCERVGILGSITRKPRIVLTADEHASGERVPDQVAIQSAGLAARFAAKTKQWFPERYQGVVDAMRGDVNFVQLGSTDDPPLTGALDLRGRTTIRESAAILARSLAFVGQVGMPMHLARAVDCRAVIVYGGRELPAQTGYSGNENLYVPVPCSPCWKVNTCPYDLECLREVTTDDVVAALRHQLGRVDEPMPVDTDVIPSDTLPARAALESRAVLQVPNVYGVPVEVEAVPPAQAAARAAG
ncbi:MAG TPA: hypothetical protein VGD56_22220 [Gemmatirosa sp.]